MASDSSMARSLLECLQASEPVSRRLSRELTVVILHRSYAKERDNMTKYRNAHAGWPERTLCARTTSIDQNSDVTCTYCSCKLLRSLVIEITYWYIGS